MAAIINEDECKAAGFDKNDINEIRRIANGLARYSKKANDLGLAIFGGTSSLSLRFDDYSSEEGALIISDVHSGDISGGDGGTSPDSNGLLRGEGV